MPTKYTDRIKLPLDGSDDIRFSTANGLVIATGYERVLFGDKGPLIEFSEQRMNKETILIPEGQKWRVKSPNSPYIEYRSRDYCNVKIMQWKEGDELTPGMFYASPFDLRSDKVPVLIERLRRRHTLQSA